MLEGEFLVVRCFGVTHTPVCNPSSHAVVCKSDKFIGSPSLTGVKLLIWSVASVLFVGEEERHESMRPPKEVNVMGLKLHGYLA